MFDVELARESVGPLLEGLRFTVQYTFVVMAICLVAAIPVAWGRLSSSRLVRWAVGTYVQVFRATPLLIQLVYIYFALPAFGVTLSPAVAGVVGLSLHYTAYIAEVYRGAILAVPVGQSEAGQALGMSKRTVNQRIVFPQAFRSVIPTLGNYWVSLFKDTSLLSIITVQELLFSGQIIAGRTFDYFTLYTLIFAIYLIVGLAAIAAVRWLERRAAQREWLPRLWTKGRATSLGEPGIGA